MSEWRPVPGYEGLYEINAVGEVRRIVRPLKQQTIHSGYKVVFLWKDGKQATKLVSRLVAEAFLGAPPTPAHVVNHCDGVKLNNDVTNLEWVTTSQNNQHAYDTGLRRRGFRPGWIHPKRKPRSTVECACGCGGLLESPDSKGRGRRFINGHNARKEPVA